MWRASFLLVGIRRKRRWRSEATWGIAENGLKCYNKENGMMESRKEMVASDIIAPTEMIRRRGALPALPVPEAHARIKETEL